MAYRGLSLSLPFTVLDAIGSPKTGDGANITLRWLKDGVASALATPTVTEVDAVNAPGEYRASLSATETDCGVGKLVGVSSTPGCVVVPVFVAFESAPTPAYVGTLATLDVDGGTFAVAPMFSLAGYVLNVVGRAYLVATHTANTVAFTLDGGWRVAPAVGTTITAEYLPGIDAAANRAALLAEPVPMRDLTNVTAPNVGDALAAATSLLAGDKTKAGTQLTVKHLDGATAAVKTLDDADNPTSAT